MKVYLVFNKDGERVAIGNNKAIYTKFGHIKASLTQQFKYYLYDKKDRKKIAKERFGSWIVKEYELKETGKTFDIENMINEMED